MASAIVHPLWHASVKKVGGSHRPCFMHLCFPSNIWKQKAPSIICRLTNKEPTTPSDMDFSIFRFTLGIPGLDESELPRIIGFSLGSLLLLNHFTTPDPIAAPQLRSEAVGILLATVAGILPSVRRLLKGSNTSVRAGLPYNLQQKLLMANWLDDTQKQDLAWGSYALIKNTKTMSVMVWFGSQVVLVRGYWNWDHEGETKEALEYFYDLLSSTPIVKSENNIYIPSGADTKGWKIVPRGATALFYHPLVSEDKKECVGGLLAISNEFHGYNKKDMVWVSSLARKFRDTLSKPPTF